jgi:hypothetical protein
LTVEAVLKPTEAGLNHYHPVIIGLVAHLIDSINPVDVLRAIRSLYKRGNDIIDVPSMKSLVRKDVKGKNA